MTRRTALRMLSFVLVLGGVFSALVVVLNLHAQPSARQIAISADQHSLTIYIPAQAEPVSLADFGFSWGDPPVARLLSDFPGLSPAALAALTPESCLRLLRVSQINLHPWPAACTQASSARPREISVLDTDVFWYANGNYATVTLLPNGSQLAAGRSPVFQLGSTFEPVVLPPIPCPGASTTVSYQGVTYLVCDWVTNAEFEQFITPVDGVCAYDNPSFWVPLEIPAGQRWACTPPAERPRSLPTNIALAQPTHPRLYVHWYEADAYCRWRGGALPPPGLWGTSQLIGTPYPEVMLAEWVAGPAMSAYLKDARNFFTMGEDPSTDFFGFRCVFPQS